MHAGNKSRTSEAQRTKHLEYHQEYVESCREGMAKPKRIPNQNVKTKTVHKYRIINGPSLPLLSADQSSICSHKYSNPTICALAVGPNIAYDLF